MLVDKLFNKNDPLDNIRYYDNTTNNLKYIMNNIFRDYIIM